MHVARTMTDLDAALVHAAKRGDRSAFEQLVTIHARAAGRLAERLVRSREDAEDVVQEAFVRAYTHLDSFRADSSFKTWLYRIVLSVAQDQLRRRGRSLAGLENSGRTGREPVDVETVASRAESTAASESRDRIEQLRAAIETLPHKQRAALFLKVYDGLSHQEVARAIGSTVGAARVYLALARQSLRRRFATWFERGDESDPARESCDGGRRP